jgi:tetratricopeptide (TPR) repeat protein
VYDALRAAIMLKNKWLTQDFNMERVRDRKEPIGIGIGMHTGRVHLCNRPDGRCRIEGYAVNLAKRIESFSRSGKYSRIMLSQDAQDVVRGSVRVHTMLRQRIFFHTHEVPLELLKGITRSKKVCELKFYVRIGIKMLPEAVEQYEALFALDPNNVWAYYQLFEHYAYVVKDWERVLELAKRAHLVHPRDEKVLLDLSRCYLEAGSLRQARRFALQALEHNEEFDLAYERLATIAEKTGVVAEQVEYMSKAVGLAPGSPVNHLNFGLVLCADGQLGEGTYHLLEAFRLYPGYLERAELLAALRELEAGGKLPPEVKEHLAAKGVELSA